MQKLKGVAMANTLTDIDPAKFAAELKEIAASVQPKKPLTKEQIIASDEVWEIVTDMIDNRGMTYGQIAEVFNKKGWNTSGSSIGQMIRKARERRGGAGEGKKARKSKATKNRSPAPTSEGSSEASKSGATEPAKSTGAGGASAGGDSKPATNTGASRKPTMAANIDPSDL